MHYNRCGIIFMRTYNKYNIIWSPTEEVGFVPTHGESGGDNAYRMLYYYVYRYTPWISKKRNKRVIKTYNEILRVSRPQQYVKTMARRVQYLLYNIITLSIHQNVYIPIPLLRIKNIISYTTTYKVLETRYLSHRFIYRRIYPTGFFLFRITVTFVLNTDITRARKSVFSCVSVIQYTYRHYEIEYYNL